jgi:hypothetical protein
LPANGDKHRGYFNLIQDRWIDMDRPARWMPPARKNPKERTRIACG